jgi:sulfide dehydrogenase cytochrome subunit
MRRALATVPVLLAAMLLAAAGDPPPGATTCSGCHAPPGVTSGFLPIYGHDAGALDAAMLAFRSSERSSTVMGRIMKGFSTDEIHAIAAWAAAQTVQAKK